MTGMGSIRDWTYIKTSRGKNAELEEEEGDRCAAALLCALLSQLLVVLDDSEMYDDGIWSLLPEQNAQQVGQRSFAKVLQALGDYEVDRLYVCLDSLASRGLEAAELMQAEGLDLAAQQLLLAEQDAVIGAAL